MLADTCIDLGLGFWGCWISMNIWKIVKLPLLPFAIAFAFQKHFFFFRNQLKKKLATLLEQGECGENTVFSIWFCDHAIYAEKLCEGPSSSLFLAAGCRGDIKHLAGLGQDGRAAFSNTPRVGVSVAEVPSADFEGWRGFRGLGVNALLPMRLSAGAVWHDV